jgi:hypothetical protein
MRHNMKLWITTAAVSVASLAALAPASQAATVCNEAENSHRGGYVVSGGTVDPNPPARLRGSQMKVGNDAARGLSIAADKSPALRQCGLPDDGGPTGTGAGGDGSSGDGGGGGDVIA